MIRGATSKHFSVTSFRQDLRRSYKYNRTYYSDMVTWTHKIINNTMH